MDNIIDWLKNRLQWIMMAVFAGQASIIIALYTESKFSENNCDKRLNTAVRCATQKDSITIAELKSTVKEKETKIYELLIDWKIEYQELKGEKLKE